MILLSLNKYPAECRSIFASQSAFNFIFYGIKSVFLFFVVDHFQLPENIAISILATFLAASYATSIMGGWIADVLVGIRSTILLGGILQTVGVYLLLTQEIEIFYMSLALLSLGTGLLKPALSAAVGASFSDPKDHRKDGAYSTFYIAMNFGSLVGPAVLGILGQELESHMASIFLCMVVSSLAVFYIFKSMVAGHPLDIPLRSSFTNQYVVWAVVGSILLFSFVLTYLFIRFHESIGGILGLIAVGTLLYFARTLYRANPAERKSIALIIPYILLFTFFCALFEQEGNSILLFFEKAVDRHIFGIEIPSPLLLSLGPIFVLLCGPFTSIVLEKISFQTAKGDGMLKLGIGFVLVSLSFILLSISCMGSGLTSPLWIICAILVQTLGELFIVPVGYSNVSKLSPQRFKTVMMSFWLMAIAYGNYFAGFIAQFSLAGEPPIGSSSSSYFVFFINLAIPALIVGAGLIGYFFMKNMSSLGLQFGKNGASR